MTAAAVLQSPQDILDFSVVYEVVPQRLARATLPRVVNEIARLFDGSRSTAEVVDHAQISATKTHAVVRKLTQLGIIRPVDAAHSTRHVEHFSAQERAFFAAEVQPIDECDLPFESLSDKLQRAARRAARALVRR